MVEAWIAVAGGPREKLEIEEGATVSDVMKARGIASAAGEIILVGDREVKGKDVVRDGETLIYVPPVTLG
jgi:hypothetical protein